MGGQHKFFDIQVDMPGRRTAIQRRVAQIDRDPGCCLRVIDGVVAIASENPGRADAGKEVIVARAAAEQFTILAA